MSYQEAPTLLVKVSSLFFFVALSILCFTWFVFASLETILAISSQAEVVMLSKGAMYALGAGLVCLVISVYGGYKSLLQKSPMHGDDRYGKITTYELVASLVVMFGLPAIAHFSVEKRMMSQSYQVCASMSDSWLFYKKNRLCQI